MKQLLSGLILLLFIFTACKKEDPTFTPKPKPDPVEIPESDKWWNDDVFYEIFVRSFYDSDGDGIGDFQGIIEKLDYLNDGDPNTDDDLGVTGIWLMPIFPSPSYHGYDVTDYRAVNEQYGTMEDFKQFIDAAHARGIKVIIDYVLNHTSTQHPWFVSSAEGSGKRSWYLWQDNNPGYSGPWGQPVWHERDGAFYYGVFWSGMPDLNFYNGNVTQEIKDIAQFWYEEVGVDGFRIDAAKHLIENGQDQENTQATLDWWRDFYAFQKNLDPGLLTVGEVWTSTNNIIPYVDQRLDFCFEFDLSYAIIGAVNNGNATGLASKIQEVVNVYPELQYGTFLTNHDQDRVIESLGQSVDKAKIAASIMLTLPGVPYLYYGEEVGMFGVKPDEDIRRPMQWTADAHAGFTSGNPWRGVNSNYVTYNVETLQADSSSIWNHYRRFIQARSRSVALKQGECDILSVTNPSVLAYLRTTSEEQVLVIHNTSAQAQEDVALSIGNSDLPEGTYTFVDLFTGDAIANVIIGSTGSLDFTPYTTLDARSTYLLKLEN